MKNSLLLASFAALTLTASLGQAHTSRPMTLQQLAAACAQINCNPNSVFVNVPAVAQNQQQQKLQQMAAHLSEDDDGNVQCHGQGCDGGGDLFGGE